MKEKADADLESNTAICADVGGEIKACTRPRIIFANGSVAACPLAGFELDPLDLNLRVLIQQLCRLPSSTANYVLSMVSILPPVLCSSLHLDAFASAHSRRHRFRIEQDRDLSVQ